MSDIRRYLLQRAVTKTRSVAAMLCSCLGYREKQYAETLLKMAVYIMPNLREKPIA